jgi:hypothetical protein
MKRRIASLLVALAAVAAHAETEAQSTFNALKKLQGTWMESKGKGKPGIKVVYKVSGAGSALFETQFPGTPMEMISVYHLDGPDKLILTHYCAAKNQPTMALKPGATAKEFFFDFVSGTNMKPTDMHIHSVRYRLIDKNHITSTWGGYLNGKTSGPPEIFDLHRVKA